MQRKSGSRRNVGTSPRLSGVALSLGDLLQELRVAFPGIQFLFAFLLVVPFQQGWTSVDGTEKHVYYVALLLTAISSICFIAPTARGIGSGFARRISAGWSTARTG